MFKLAGNLQAMPVRIMPIDVGSEKEITCGNETPARLFKEQSTQNLYLVG